MFATEGLWLDNLPSTTNQYCDSLLFREHGQCSEDGSEDRQSCRKQQVVAVVQDLAVHEEGRKHEESTEQVSTSHSWRHLISYSIHIINKDSSRLKLTTFLQSCWGGICGSTLFPVTIGQKHLVRVIAGKGKLQHSELTFKNTSDTKSLSF